MALPLPFLSPEKSRFLPVPDELKEALFPAQLCLFEWTDYWFEWRGATHLQVGGARVEPFAPGLFRIRFENALGATHIEPFCGADSFDGPLAVEVLSPKFPSAEKHLRFFRALLEDVFARAEPLPFDFLGQTVRGIDLSKSSPSPCWTRLFLTQNAAALSAALRQFLSSPGQEWQQERVWTQTQQATRFDATAMLTTARESSVWRRENARFQPAYVAQNRVWEREETVETRFIAALTRQLAGAIDALETNEWLELRGVCALVMSRFPSLSPTIDASSPRLQRRAVTRELVRFYELWSGAGAPLFARFERAAHLRDIAQLFEIWTFFVLCDEIGRILGQTPKFQVSVEERDGLQPLSRAVFQSGTLVYNGPASSYSTPLRPDFLWLENGAPTLAFDAKFRLELPQNEGKMSGRGVDLHKMHAYRDALGVRAAVAIHPGTESVFFERGSGQRVNFSLDGLLSGTQQGVRLWARQPGT